MSNSKNIWMKILRANAERWKTEKPAREKPVRADKTVVIEHVPGESLSYWDRPGLIRDSILSDLYRI